MKPQNIAILIQEHFKFVKTPTESEVTEILLRLSNTTTEEEFQKIVYDIVKNKISYLLDSLDMSASKNILLQIKKAAGK